MSPTKPLVALAAAIGLLGSMKAALAQSVQTCATDSDCQHGYACQVTQAVGTVVCGANTSCNVSGQGGSTPAPDDPANSGGVDPTSGSGTAGTGTTGDASVTTVSTCQPAPCSIDSDCAAGMICHGEMVTSCSGGGEKVPCPAGTKCADPVVVSPPTCTTTTVSTCTFKWALPCNADADCGDGFACHPTIGGACSGGAPSTGVGGDTGGSATGNSGATQPPDTCTTTMTYPGSCRPVTQSCSSDTDCPSNWLCQDVVTRNVVAVGGTAGAGGSVAVPATDGGAGSGVSSSGAADVAPGPNVKLCVSPYSTPLGVKEDGTGGREGSGPTGGTPTGTSSPGNDGMTTGSNEGGGATGGTTGASTLAGTGGTATPHSPAVSGNDSGGCSVTPAAGSPAGLLAGLGAGLAMLVARRRRRS